MANMFVRPRRRTSQVIWSVTALLVFVVVLGFTGTWKPPKANLAHYRLGAGDIITGASAYLQSTSFAGKYTTQRTIEDEQASEDDENLDDRVPLAGEVGEEGAQAFTAAAPTQIGTPSYSGKSTPSPSGLPNDESQWACAESGYCSFGKTKPFFGELDSTQGLRTALEYTAYKKDIFLVTIGNSAHALGVNFVASMWRLGLNNVMLFADSEASCQKLREYKLGNISCGWSTAEWWPVKLAPSRNIWVRRYMIQARAVHVGYNIYNIDTDAWLYDDPYKYLKQKPFVDIDIISMQDGYYGGSVNGGANYFQVKDHHGPAGWLSVAIVDRMLRMCENWQWFRDTTNVTERYLELAVDDQAVWRDILFSAILNRPITSHTWFDLHGIELFSKIQGEIHWSEFKTFFQYPDSWLPRSSVKNETVTTVDIHKLKLDVDAWKPEVALLPFPQRKNASLFFLNRLKEESGYIHDDGESKESKNDRKATAKWMFAPPWLVGLSAGRARHGFWDMNPPAQVIAHLVGVMGIIAPPPDQKAYALKAHNAFDYDAVAMVTGNLFPQSTPERVLPRVLALAPKLTVKPPSQRAYRAYVLNMMHFAKLTNRVLVVPQLDCEVSWIEGKPSEETKMHGHTHVIYNSRDIAFYGNDDDETCVWGRLVDSLCMKNGYMVQQDYRELLKRVPEHSQASTSVNTVLFKEERTHTQKRTSVEFKNVRNVTAGELLAAVKQLDDQHVVYIGEAVLFDRLEELDPAMVLKMDEFIKKCGWAYTKDLPDVEVELPPKNQGRRRMKWHFL